MKILKYGEGYPKTVTCEGCESELEYELEDTYVYTDHYVERSETFTYIKCPVCGREIVVDIRIVEHVEHEKPKKRWWKR